MRKPVRTLTAAAIETHPNLAAIQNTISVFDNLEKAIVMPQEEKDKLTNSPIKSVSTMTVLMCLDGTADIRIGLQDFKLGKNECVFLKSGVVADMKDMSDDCRFFSILLNEDFYFPIFTNTTLSVLQKSWMRNPVCHLDERYLDECLAIYLRIKERLLSPSPEVFQVDILKGYVQSLLYILHSVYFMQEEQKREQTDSRVSRKRDLYNRFIELLERDFMRERNITYYADQLCITPRYLSQVVYQESGHYASEHIDNFVISEAKQLVRSRQYTIQQICDMLHFSSQSFFGRYFKKFTGYSPTQYQRLED